MDPRVETALAALGREQPEVGAAARQAWDALTGGSGEARTVSQWWLQMFCWDLLARDTDVTAEQRWATASALADLLQRIGLHRYADIARSDATREVLLASDDPERYERAYAEALRASGIQPPDTDLLTWGGVMGPVEADTYERVAHTLELSLVSGDLVAGRRGAGPVRAAVTDAVLTSPWRDLDGTRPLHRIAGERLGRWRAASPTLASLLEPLAEDLTAGVPVPLAPAPHALRPLRGLLRVAAEPVGLTAAGYLPPAAVDAVVREGGLDHPAGTARRESDVPQVLLLRHAAQRLGVVRVHRGALVLTPRGRAATTGPERLVAAVAAGWFPVRRRADVVAREVVTALLAGGERPSSRRVAETVQRVLTEEGWRMKDGPVPLHAAEAVALQTRRDQVALGMAPPGSADRRWGLREGVVPILRAALRHHLLHHGAPSPGGSP